MITGPSGPAEAVGVTGVAFDGFLYDVVFDSNDDDDSLTFNEVFGSGSQNVGVPFVGSNVFSDTEAFALLVAGILDDGGRPAPRPARPSGPVPVASGIDRRSPRGDVSIILATGGIMKRILAAATLATLTTAAPAAVFITAVENPGEVVFSYTGELDVSGLATTGTVTNDRAAVGPATGAILFGAPLGGDFYGTVLPFDQFGTAGGPLGVATGSGFSVFSDGVGLPAGYAGESISGDLTVAGESFASLGLIAGIYEIVLPTGADFIRLTIPDSTSPIPLPAPAFLLLSGLAVLAFVRRRA
ncbi:MAG: VPLPA-CTERM sorting domain-containing protein [Paracoccaceae bacterium]